MCSQLAWVLSAVSALSDAQKSRSLVLVISGLVHARCRTSHGSCFLASHTGRCRVATLLTETPVLPDEKLGTASSSGNLLQAGCLLWGFFLYFVAVWDFWHDFSTIFFQANSETRHGKSEWFVHVKSLWSLLEQLERFCDLDQKPVRWQGKIFVFWPLQNTPPKDDQITNLWKNK